MRSSLPRTLRQFSRNVTIPRLHRCRVAGARWNSSTTKAQEEGGHIYSTPLAKQLTDAITVRHSTASYTTRG